MAVDTTQQYAQEQDKQDPIRHLRSEFRIPSKADLKATSLKQECQHAPPLHSETAILIPTSSNNLRHRLGPMHVSLR